MNYEFAVVYYNVEDDEMIVIGFARWEDACAEVEKLFREEAEYYSVEIPNAEDDDCASFETDSVYCDDDVEIMGYDTHEWYSAKLKDCGVTIISISAHKINKGEQNV